MNNFDQTFASELETPTKKYREVSKNAVITAFHFLFPNRNVPKPGDKYDAFFSDFERFVQERQSQIGCVVLYKFNNRFNKFLEKYGESIGKKEVIINNSGVRTSENYLLAPRP